MLLAQTSAVVCSRDSGSRVWRLSFTAHRHPWPWATTLSHSKPGTLLEYSMAMQTIKPEFIQTLVAYSSNTIIILPFAHCHTYYTCSVWLPQRSAAQEKFTRKTEERKEEEAEKRREHSSINWLSISETRISAGWKWRHRQTFAQTDRKDKGLESVHKHKKI